MTRRAAARYRRCRNRVARVGSRCRRLTAMAVREIIDASSKLRRAVMRSGYVWGRVSR